METMQSGQTPTLMAQLKAATAAAHARVQTAPFFKALAAGQLPLESYVGQLRALLAIHGVIEPLLADSTDPRIRAVWRADMARLHLLQQDLHALGSRSVADRSEALLVAQQACDQLRLQSMAAPLALLGWVYVLEGSTLGAEIVRPMVARALRLSGGEGTAYLYAHGADNRAYWAAYGERMNALALSADERDALIAAANALFGLLDELFHALYPFRPAVAR